MRQDRKPVKKCQEI